MYHLLCKNEIANTFIAPTDITSLFFSDFLDIFTIPVLFLICTE